MSQRLTLFLYAHELCSMPEYSTTLPTATTIGKMWRTHDPPMHCDASCRFGACGQWAVGMYVEHMLSCTRILWFDVVLRHGPAPPSYSAPDWHNYATWKLQEDKRHAVHQ